MPAANAAMGKESRVAQADRYSGRDNSDTAMQDSQMMLLNEIPSITPSQKAKVRKLDLLLDLNLELNT